MISEDDYTRHLEVTDGMSVAELGEYVRNVLGCPPPDDKPGWSVRVDYVDTPAGSAERFTWQRTLRHIVDPEDIEAAA